MDTSLQIIESQIAQHQITLKALLFQQQVYTMRPQEYLALNHEINKNQLRLNQLTYKRDVCFKPIPFSYY